MQAANPLFRGYSAVIGFVAAIVAAIIGIVVAVTLALSVVVIGLFGGILLAVASLAMRARRSSKKKAQAEGDSQIIEAHRVGGHSWVAYGWDNRQ